MGKYIDICEKMAKEPVYLINEYENIVIRSGSTNGDKFFAKQPAGAEYEIDFSADIVQTALMEGVEITKKEYDEY